MRAMNAAQAKLVAAMPADLRVRATRMQTRFHLDAPGWFGEAEEPQHLRAIADALLADRDDRNPLPELASREAPAAGTARNWS